MVVRQIKLRPSDAPDWHFQKTRPPLARRFPTVSGRGRVLSKTNLHNSQTNQHSYARISKVRSKGSVWALHGAYLQRKGGQREEEKGIGFDRESDEVNLSETLSNWQHDGDSYTFRGYISPTKGEHGSLQEHTRAIMEAVEKDLGVKLQWAAIDHHDRPRLHVHILIRNIDANGNRLTFNEYQLSRVFRAYSEQDLTNKLGYRLVHDELRERAAFVTHERWTTLDDSLLRRANTLGEVHFPEQIAKPILDRERDEHARRRLRFLADRYGVATEIDDTRWQLRPDAKNILQQVVKTRHYSTLHARHQETLHKQVLIDRTQLKDGQSLTGRVLGEGEVNPLTHTRYVLLEKGKHAAYIELKSKEPLPTGRMLTVQQDNGDAHVVTQAQEQTVKQEQEEQQQKRVHTQAIRVDLTEMVQAERTKMRAQRGEEEEEVTRSRSRRR